MKLKRTTCTFGMTALVLLFGAGVSGACREANDGAARNRTGDAWQGLRSDGDRLVDQVQTHHDSKAKQNLLDRCHDAVERLHTADDARASRVDAFCDSIRETDPNTSAAWNDIRQRLAVILREAQS